MLLTFGTVLDDGEDAACPRAVAAAGPALAAAYHAIYESKGADGVDKLPGGRQWREAVEAVEPSRRHLAIHDGHLVALGQHDEALLAQAAPLLASWTMTGTRADIGARLRALTPAGSPRSPTSRWARTSPVSWPRSPRPRGWRRGHGEH